MKNFKFYSFEDTYVGYIDHVACFVPSKKNNPNEVYLPKWENNKFIVHDVFGQKDIENPTFEQKMFALLNYVSYDNSKNPVKTPSSHYHLNPADLFVDFMLCDMDRLNKGEYTTDAVAAKWALPESKKKLFKIALDNLENEIKNEETL